jgi:hypothetical protein
MQRMRREAEEEMKCLCCMGDGGELDVILDDGTGPYYPCGYCKGNGEVNLFMWIKWVICVKVIWK